MSEECGGQTAKEKGGSTGGSDGIWNLDKKMQADIIRPAFLFKLFRYKMELTNNSTCAIMDMEIDMENYFGSALRGFRREARLSQRDLAEKVGVDFSYISKIENGRLPPPSADTIVQICKILNIPPKDLLALTGKIPSDITQTIAKNSTAQEFLREVQEMGLTEDEWRKLVGSLRKLRGSNK